MEVLRLALLVEEPSSAEVGQLLADLGQEQQGADIVFLGPWPPYSFTDLRPPDDGRD